MEGPGGQQSLDAELEQLSGRGGGLVLRVLRENLLDHETPVAVRPVVRVRLRGVVMRPHVQVVLHGKAWVTFSSHLSGTYSPCSVLIVQNQPSTSQLSSETTPVPGTLRLYA